MKCHELEMKSDNVKIKIKVKYDVDWYISPIQKGVENIDGTTNEDQTKPSQQHWLLGPVRVGTRLNVK